jgi:hypothetical protein
MKKFAKIVAVFVMAVIATSLLGSIFSTQFVLAGLQGLGVEIPISDRFSMTLADFGILPAMGILYSICLLAGFLVAGLCAMKIGGSRTTWFVAAGASAVICELLILSALMDLMILAGARTTMGLVAQGVAGGVGGWVFAVLTARFSSTGNTNA